MIVVSDIVRAEARAIGPDGERWLAELPCLVAALATEWDLDIGDALAGGTSSHVTTATALDGTPVVLKVAVPLTDPDTDPFRSELVPLLLGKGRGYARVLHHDTELRAYVLERLGPRLHEFGLPVAAQLEIICATLQEAWIPAPAGTGMWTTADKGPWLARFITDAWDRCGRPCARTTIDRAIGFAQSRTDAFDPASALLLHGDAHVHNTLHDPRASGDGPLRCKFIDPDGVIGDAAYDLAIPMREFNEELHTGDAVELGLARRARLHELTGVDERAIWEWGFVERVSTGLLYADLGQPDEAALFLEIADAWAGVTG